MTPGERAVPTETGVIAPLASLSGALFVVGLPFAVQWERANGIDTVSFGGIVAGVVVAGIVLAFIFGTRVDRWRGKLLSFGLLIAAAGSTVVIASRSEAITAEGLVTAMMLPVGLLAAGVLASLLDARVANSVESANIRSLLVMAMLVVLSAAVAWRLPVVQFIHAARADGIYPVHGSVFAFLGGVAAGAIVGPVGPRWRWNWITLLIPSAAAFGYTMQAAFGAALALLGVCVAMPAWSSSRQRHKHPV